MEFVVGIVCGVILSFIFGFGPVFFGLIQNSIQYGFRKSMMFVAGVLMSDVVIVLLMLTVLGQIDMYAVVRNPWVASICGLALIWLGVRSFRRKVMRPRRKEHDFSKLDNNERIPLGLNLFLHGLLLNLLNPLVWLYWVSIISFLTVEMDLKACERYIFFFGLLSGSFGCDTLKCRLASLMQSWFTPRIMVWLNRVIGVCMMLFGVYLIGSMVVAKLNPRIEPIEPNLQNTKIIQNVHKRMGRDTDSCHTGTDTAYFDTASGQMPRI